MPDGVAKNYITVEEKANFINNIKKCFYQITVPLHGLVAETIVYDYTNGGIIDIFLNRWTTCFATYFKNDWNGRCIYSISKCDRDILQYILQNITMFI